VYWLGAHLDGMDRQLANFSRSLRRPKSGPHRLQSKPQG
jgi:hypothetical protein